VQKKANETAFKTFSSLQSFLGTMGKIGSFAQRGFFIPHTNMSFGETRPQLVFSQTSSPPEMFGSFSLSGFFFANRMHPAHQIVNAVKVSTHINK